MCYIFVTALMAVFSGTSLVKKLVADNMTVFGTSDMIYIDFVLYWKKDQYELLPCYTYDTHISKNC